MNILTNSTFKSVYASIGLHAIFIVVGSWAFYKKSVSTLELTGRAGGGGRTISLSDISFVSKKSASSSLVNQAIVKPIKEVETINTISTASGVVGASMTGGGGSVSEAGSGTGSGTGNGVGSGAGDFDQGHLFSQIKKFYETRLGSTLNVRENQLIKIKLTLNAEGDILDANIIQGELEMSALRRIISVAKNIPLKSFWKGPAHYPKEIIIPLVLTPG
jgi:hypothetical protein